MRREDLDADQTAQLDLEDEAERRRMMRETSIAFSKAAELPQPRRLSASAMYSSTPLPGVRSPFTTTDGRYFASEEDARRAQLELDERASRESARIAAAADRLAAQHQVDQGRAA